MLKDHAKNCFINSSISPRMVRVYENVIYTNKKWEFLGLYDIYAQEYYLKVFYNSLISPRLARVYANIMYSNKEEEFTRLLCSRLIL